jgi:hypothetical protein
MIRYMYKLGFILFFCSISVLGQVRSSKEVQGAMLFNMIKYVQWPNESEAGDFVLGVLGDDEIYLMLRNVYDGKLKGTKKIAIVKLESAKDAGNCSVVYLGDQRLKDFEDVKSLVSNKPILLVTDSQNLSQRGSHINFKEIDGRLRYELNQSTFETSSLKVSSALKVLAN